MGDSGGEQRPHLEEVIVVYRGLDLTVLATDSEHRGYYEAAAQGQLVVQRCGACALLRGEMGAACPFCLSQSWDWHPVSGEGAIFSYQIVTQAIQPAFADWCPYAVVLVDLDEQRSVPWRAGREGETVSVRLVRNLVQAGDPTRPESEELVAIGKRVRVCFVPLGEGLALPQFCLSDELPEHEPWRAA
jgi:uncharacterized OB-fold protein